ncbi:Hypothetical predicted protein [Mytilus galloprovincialis]|uniref:Uncharacterized protein n=1 Tax=Mytilus galloprovincialis TaxID=29158 RepID=A0A8B6GIF0_MYTGA|nr:Hypothetical predicted protein [Mytilus galloprovincialis]
MSDTYSNEIKENEADEGLNDFFYFLEGHGIVDLTNGMRIRTKPELSQDLKCFKAERWKAEERNMYLNELSFPSGFKLVTDIYKISIKSEKSGLEKASDPSEMKRLGKRQCLFSLRDSYKDHSDFQVPVDNTYIKDGDISHYWALIEDGENQWKKIPARITFDFIEFACRRLNSFLIVSSPKKITHVVHPEGSTTHTGKDNGMTVQFEKGCVNQELTLEYTVQRPSGKYKYNDSYSTTQVKAVSHKITLDYKNAKLKRSINISARLNNDSNETTDSDSTDDSNVQMVLFKKGKLTIQTPTRLTTGEYTGKIIDSEESVLFARIKRHQKLTAELAEELELFYGNRMLCNILLFYEKKHGKTIHLITECCLKQHAEFICAEHQNDGKVRVFASKDVFLPPHQRIRIRPDGCLRPKTIRKGHPHSFLYFMYLAKDNFTSFSVEFWGSLGNAMNAVIEFSADNQKRGDLAKADFNINSILVPKYFDRANTMI